MREGMVTIHNNEKHKLTKSRYELFGQLGHSQECIKIQDISD